jgi:hypothetical protein
MLRYDRAIVRDWSASQIILETTGNSPTEGRWSSFGLPIYDVEMV